MSDAGVVDAIGLDRESDEVVLSVADDLPWVAPKEHLETLLQKLSAYLAFVRDGSLRRRFPQSIGRSVRIDIVFRHAPPAEADVPLFQMKRLVRDAGHGFSRRSLEEQTA